MSTSAASDYGVPAASEASGQNLMDLHVVCFNGEGCRLKLSPSTLGLEVRKMVSEQLQSKQSVTLMLHHKESPLVLHLSLKGQGISGEAATLSCTYVPTDLYAAMLYLQGFQVPERECEFGVQRT